MTTLRRLSYATIVLAFAQIVFGAIVRITGSGMGCGDHWPRCNGVWFPPYDRMDLVIEISHRYIAATLTLAILGLVAAAVARRREPGVGGAGGVLRPVLLAAALVVTAAVFGAVTVKMALDPYIIVTHLSIAMTLLAVLALAAIRAGGFGAATLTPGSDGAARTFRAARAAAGLAFLALVFGALTANVPEANGACQGFPWCRAVLTHGGPLHIQLTHRAIAFLLLFHTFGMVMMTRRRAAAGPGTAAVLARGAVASFGVVLLQIVIAAVLVETHLPPVWRSLHQAVGTLVWLTLFTFAALASRAARPAAAALVESAIGFTGVAPDPDKDGIPA